MNWETYAAFGDSITRGSRTYLGYPEVAGDILRQRLSKQWNVINHAVNGYKAIDLARWIDPYYVHLLNQKPSISSILTGTNDIKENTSPNDFSIALNQIILKVKLITQNQNVFIIKIPHLHEGVMYPYTIQMNEQIIALNEVIIKQADLHQVRYLSIDHVATDFLDGIHLNDQGLKTFGRQVANFILKDRGVEAV